MRVIEGFEKYIGKFLGFLGFSYCPHCGGKLWWAGTRSYDELDTYLCPHCDHLDRFDVYDLKFEGGERIDAEKSQNNDTKR